MYPIFIFIQEYLRLPVFQMTKFEHEILIYVDAIAPTETTQRDYFYKEFFSGAYIFIPDNGETYQTFVEADKNNLINRDYSSSHYSLNTQYASQGALIGECLFGTTILEGQVGTWLQLEAYSSNLLQTPAHLASYVGYIFTGYNHGPHGYSEYTEKLPLILNINEPLNPLSSHYIISSTHEQNNILQMNTAEFSFKEQLDPLPHYHMASTTEPNDMMVNVDNIITLSDIFVESSLQESKCILPLQENASASIEIMEPMLFIAKQEEILPQPEVNLLA